MRSDRTEHDSGPRDAASGVGMTRRGFLRHTAAGIAGAALLAVGIGKLVPGGESRMSAGETLDRLRKADFAGHIGESFTIRRGQLDTVTVRLAEVADIRHTAPQGADDSFSLLFAGPASRPLEQDTYGVEHDSLGSFPLFIVPVYSGNPEPHYEAIFNRTTAPGV